jgi:hypothetical protein
MNISVEELRAIAANLALENVVLRIRLVEAEQRLAELQPDPDPAETA